MIRAASLAALAILAGCATVAPPTASPPPGYLSSAQIEPLAAAIRALELSTETSPAPEPSPDRWWLAIAHAELRPPFAAQHFDCALGTRLSARPRPGLTRLMNRLLSDATALTTDVARRHAPTARPITLDPSLQPCQRITPAMAAGSAYPAAGAVAGTLYGEAFAVLAPERAEAVRHIGEAIGDSRAVCRMNSEQDVLAGQQGGRSLFATISRSPEFQADLEVARTEIDAARAEGLTSPACAAERRALGPAGDQLGRGLTSDP